jgi:uncharacterized membrane protein YqjE
VIRLTREALVSAIGQRRLSSSMGERAGWSATGRDAALPLLCILAVVGAASSYGGIEGDARIYMARAIADLDSQGVGQDMMFTLDGQSAFSVFGVFAAKLVAMFGLGGTSLGLACLNLTVWMAAMAVFASRLASSNRALGLLIVCCAVLRCPYGFYPLMSAREIIAVPRPLSEAAILLALAMLCEGRTVVCFGLLAIAALVHPIMALPGVAVAIVVLGWQDRRWLIGAGIAVAVVLVMALAGLPLLARLTQVIDAPWRALLEDRNPYLFINLWPAISLAPLSLQATTVLIAAMLCEGKPRLVFLAALIVGASGMAAAWLLGDLMSLLLVVQIQPWRAMWLVSVLAMPGLGLCILRLPGYGQWGQVALAFLALAWITFDATWLTPCAALIAFVAFVVSQRQAPRLSAFFVPLVWAVVILASAIVMWGNAAFYILYFKSLPSFMPWNPIRAAWSLGLVPLVVVLLATAWVRWPACRYERAVAGATLVGLLALIATSWDSRSDAKKLVEANRHDAALVDLVASKPGEVLWLSRTSDGDVEWYWLGRPQWNTFTQAGGIVFSRPLAMRWRERADLLIALGMLDQSEMRPWRLPAAIVTPQLASSSVAQLCARPDAPAWIVAPLPSGNTLPPGLGGSIWHAPVKQAAGTVQDEKIIWRVFDRYAVVPCSGGRP